MRALQDAMQAEEERLLFLLSAPLETTPEEDLVEATADAADAAAPADKAAADLTPDEIVAAGDAASAQPAVETADSGVPEPAAGTSPAVGEGAIEPTRDEDAAKEALSRSLPLSPPPPKPRPMPIEADRSGRRELRCAKSTPGGATTQVAGGPARSTSPMFWTMPRASGCVASPRCGGLGKRNA